MALMAFESELFIYIGYTVSIVCTLPFRTSDYSEVRDAFERKVSSSPRLQLFNYYVPIIMFG